jgi:hypothetical protein
MLKPLPPPFCVSGSGENCANPLSSGDNCVISANGDENASAPPLASSSGLASPTQSSKRLSPLAISADSAAAPELVNVGLISSILSLSSMSNKPVPIGQSCPSKTLFETPRN